MVWNHMENTDEEKKLKRDISVCVCWVGWGLHFCLLVSRHLCMILFPTGLKSKKKKSHFNFIQFCDY